MSRRGGRRWRLVAGGVVLALCCTADLWLLRTVWLGRDLAAGQLRRGYFEPVGNGIGIAMDDSVRSIIIPLFFITDGGDLAVPPGTVGVMSLTTGTSYELAPEDSALAPYVVIGRAQSVPPDGVADEAAAAAAQLVGARTLALRDGRLALVEWDSSRPWREDAARLSALREACADGDAAVRATVTAAPNRVEVRLGRCAAADALTGIAETRLALAALGGPNWVTVARRPEWIVDLRIAWPMIAAVFVKVAAMWWVFGLPSAAAASGALGVAGIAYPVPAVLTWLFAAVLSLAAAALRAAAMALRRLPPRPRLVAALAGVGVVALVVWSTVVPPASVVPNWHSPDWDGSMACAVIGYSTVEDIGLRGERGGLRWMLDERCARCRKATASLSIGGGTLGWLSDTYCRTIRSFGEQGQVTFLGGANDDFLSGTLNWARLLIQALQNIESWRRNNRVAAKASLARVDMQQADLEELVRCARSRDAQFVFLHDFVIGDLPAGRDADRATLLDRRRSAVEKAGGHFVDLLDRFGAEAGVSWFDDYVHLSLIAHDRVADIACHPSP